MVLEPIDGAIEVTPERAGMYSVWSESTDSAGNRIDALSFAANVDTEESNLAMLSDDTLGPWVGDGQDQQDAAAAKREAEKRVNLWPFFLFCVTLFLLLETILGTRRSVLARVGRAITRRPEPGID